MLRVGLTGGLGSGKSTVAAMLRPLGAHVIEADALGRELMQPGQPVHAAIVARFGPEVVGADGLLNRARLAEVAFRRGRLQELNSIVHPPVIEAQARWMDGIFARDSAAIAVIESALIFEVVRDARARGEQGTVLADWRRRMDRIIVVTAPDEIKIARYVARIQSAGSEMATDVEALRADARNRLTHQIPDADKVAEADYVLDNSGSIEQLRAQVEAVWPRLRDDSNKSGRQLSLQ